MITSVYPDTSVFGGYFDIEFSEDTIPFFERIVEEKVKVFFSELLKDELFSGPDYLKEILYFIPEEQIINIYVTNEVEQLAELYVKEKVVGESSFADCVHIALATVNKADILVSWNFKHIVNIDRIRGYNSVNLKMGYPLLEIRTPKEVNKYE